MNPKDTIVLNGNNTRGINVFDDIHEFRKQAAEIIESPDTTDEQKFQAGRLLLVALNSLFFFAPNAAHRELGSNVQSGAFRTVIGINRLIAEALKDADSIVHMFFPAAIRQGGFGLWHYFPEDGTSGFCGVLYANPHAKYPGLSRNDFLYLEVFIPAVESRLRENYAAYEDAQKAALEASRS